LHQWQPVLAQRVTTQLAHLPDLPDRKQVVVGGLVSGVKRTITRSGSAMAFLTLEDLTGNVEVVVFPRVYEQQGFAFKRDAVLLLRGKVDIDEQSAKLLCEEVLPLPPTPGAAAADGTDGNGRAPVPEPEAAANGGGFAREADEASDGLGDDASVARVAGPGSASLRIRVTTREEIEQLERYLLDHPGDREVCVHVVTDDGEEHIVPSRARLHDDR